MKTRTIFATLAVPATALGLFAQQSVTISGGQRGAGEGVVMAQSAAGMMGLSGEPGNVRFFTQEFTVNGRPVTGAPYSADDKTESVQTLADGTHITNTTTTRLYRDSEGRTRREMTLPSFGKETQPHTMITISDPVAGTSYSLDPETKTAHKMAAVAAEARPRVEASVAHLPDGVTMNPQAGIQIFKSAHMVSPAAKREDLGANVMEGVSVVGTRETSTIEAGAMGNDRPITITSERWFSPDLKMEVKSVRNDPRTGETTHTVSNISRTEPNASLFQVPADYKVEEGNKTGGQTFKYEFHQ